MKLIDRVNSFLFNNFIHITRFLTETEIRDFLGRPTLQLLAKTTLFIKNGQSRDNINDAAREWQKMFPDPSLVPIVKTEGDTVFAEIHVTCPYRNTGNFTGCYRMMEYDRTLLRKIGAELVILKSQAEPNQEYCLVAITRNAAAHEELVPAHHRENSLWRK